MGLKIRQVLEEDQFAEILEALKQNETHYPEAGAIGNSGKWKK